MDRVSSKVQHDRTYALERLLWLHCEEWPGSCGDSRKGENADKRVIAITVFISGFFFRSSLRGQASYELDMKAKFLI